MSTDNINQHNDPEKDNIQHFDSPGDDGAGTGDDDKHVKKITGLYKDWFLDYASYVILERAVPHINDGLKPVQRRILHSMRRLEDGRYHKVANIIGNTMMFHPHGDASIGDALVQMGQKEVLVDPQGNWGNTFTGDGAAAPRYIEARLSKFALDVVFNPKTTEWKLSYDGRNNEPVTLPVKFPLLLAQGVEGIAVGLASKILPHNFNELIDASIAHLKGKAFELYPDFPSGGLIDVSRYNDGLRGGVVRIRSKISKLDNKTLVIEDIPYGKTTTTLIDSVIKANEKGKIKIKKIDDNTAEKVEIHVHLAPGISSDKTIDALYAFTDCEIPISPNACVIEDEKPKFLGVSDILKHCTIQTRELLTKELEIRKSELQEDWHQASLEKIFILNEIYEDIKDCKTEEEILTAIDEGLKPFVKNLWREVTHDDLVRLSNIPIKRISKYSSFKADEYIKRIEEEISEVEHHLNNIIPYTIKWYENIKKKYGKGRERKTEIRNFDVIEATKVVVANEKLYVNRKEGFVGMGLKKDEYVCDCSDIDDLLTIRKDGTYKITKVADKDFVGKDIIHVSVFNKNDNRTIYNLIYRDGYKGAIMIKRCAITGLTRDKDYSLTKGTEGSEILYLSVNPNGEAEIVKVYLKPRPRLRNLIFEANFAEQVIKGKNAAGNILTKYGIHKIVLKEKGESTLGGQNVYFDKDVNRFNHDGNGDLLGEFKGNEKVVIITDGGQYRTTVPDTSQHLETNILKIEKFDPEKVYTAVFYDADQQYYYLKRFTPEASDKLIEFIGDNPESKLVALSDQVYPRFEITFGGKHKSRDPEIIEADDFIAVKSYKARGKRLTTFAVKTIKELEPVKFPESPNNASNNDDSDDADDADPNNQMKLDW
ncbi:MAG: DNA gyrase/topoisomerase IV subunit A [Bacteroidetes bacterium]|jgi:topoisomerase-4 subunit A|nr:DNA gyrase/topoisomerase IV subunit A [Bacteroidota bacterium]